MLPRDHPLTRFDTLWLDQLSGENYVDRLTFEMRQAVLQTCDSSGIELYVKFRSEREDWVQSVVAAGLGFAFILEHSVLVENVIIRPHCQNLSRNIEIASMPGLKFSKLVSQFYRAEISHNWS